MLGIYFFQLSMNNFFVKIFKMKGVFETSWGKVNVLIVQKFWKTEICNDSIKTFR